jgi:hypothetical protein
MSWRKLESLVYYFGVDCHVVDIDFFLGCGMDQLTIHLTKGKSRMNISLAAKLNRDRVTIYPRKLKTINNFGIPSNYIMRMIDLIESKSSFSIDPSAIERKRFPFKLRGLEFLNGDDYEEN